MQKFSSVFIALILLCISNQCFCQNIITQWNFNSSPADASTTTGTTMPSQGAGTISLIGSTTATFASGTASGGSSDPAATDNTGWNTAGYPTISASDRTAGIRFNVSTAGKSNIVVSFDLRHSNTASRFLSVQYSTDVTAGTVIWTEFAIDSATGGDTWFNKRTYVLAAITALNNNPNAGFRVVSTFEPGQTSYRAASATGTYAGTGTWRFDMVTVKDTVLAAPGAVTFVGTRAEVMESATTFTVVARLANGIAPASAELEILPIGTAATGTDFMLPASLKFEWPANSNNVNDTLVFTINNDNLPEATEYAIGRLINPVNATVPAASANHYTVFIKDNDQQAPVAAKSIELQYIGSFSNSFSGVNSAEVVDFDSTTRRLFVANSVNGRIDIINFGDPTAPVYFDSIAIRSYGNINSIAVRNGVIAAAIENFVPQSAGTVVFFDINGNFLSQVMVGAMPDMIVFTKDGSKILTANEGEPNSAYTNDPEGSISIINLSGGVAALTNANVATAGFASFNTQATQLKNSGVRIFGPGASVAQDLEPEYITISPDGTTAYVTCQENNAVAVVNIATATVTQLLPLGTKDHSVAGNALDANDQVGLVQIANWPVKGNYMPDAIASYEAGGQTYLVTANEGDSREYFGFSEQVRLSSATYILDPVKFPFPDALKANLGRINVTTASGDTDGDGDFDEINVFGSRSFSIWNSSTGQLVWDSKDQLERITSADPVFGSLFNVSNSNNTFKNRSDDKGPEPEGVTVARIFGRTFAFVTLERIGGCMVYDVSDPANPVFVDYKNSRSVNIYGGDNGPEGLILIPANQSPNGNPILVMANEVSSTLSFYNIITTLLNITLADITAQADNKRNIVRWTTAGEEAGDVFELERSKDGRNFTFLSVIKANGAASGYLYNDDQPLQGWSYYRLKMKHRTGESTYSKVVAAVQNSARSLLVKLYPNPVTSQLVIESFKKPSANASVQMFNQLGTLIFQQNIVKEQTVLNVKLLPAGTYYLRYVDGVVIETSTFIKH